MRLQKNTISPRTGPDPDWSGLVRIGPVRGEIAVFSDRSGPVLDEVATSARTGPDRSTVRQHNFALKIAISRKVSFYVKNVIVSSDREKLEDFFGAIKKMAIFWAPDRSGPDRSAVG